MRRRFALYLLVLSFVYLAGLDNEAAIRSMTNPS